ncbi:MAG: tRNA uridine-5-carboxymethylaminomethyl(34) synthesis enzyme MnmG [Acidiferrobacteraceae bacterium]|nr:tRNA uridine-5-carboxymethylaminomethyl(34) synthesis enzyme MnmG [Acidiferrobacteraceae bacterium]
MQSTESIDVIVIGGGHAGTEAALSAARLGATTLLITHRLDTIGQMSCNPAIGGIGKGHIVKELDALGGAMASAIDRSGIQFRILNASKGPAVRATRAQADRALYRQAICSLIKSQAGLSVLEESVEDLWIERNALRGVITSSKERISARSVVLTAGTFLAGRIHMGLEQEDGGRIGDAPSRNLAARLKELPFRVGRLKTGTPPRLDGRTIDYSRLLEQRGDLPVPVFSFLGSSSQHPKQISCYITGTNEKTHSVIRSNLSLSPMYSGSIEGVGPRYCPSVEDKVVRFPDRETHQIFLEPEGLTTDRVYPNGISTGLPLDSQIEMVRTIAGLEQAVVEQPGYAIEYDYFDPRDLRSTLETRAIRGLFFAGQINGTTGYEEAAGQGLIAGINAGRSALDYEPWTPRRDQAYIGVMIDDLVTRGVTEPYRMFTSRAEYRLQLREDNADLRLTEIGRGLGLIDEARWRRFSEKKELLAAEKERFRNTWVLPDSPAAKRLEAALGQPLRNERSLAELLRRPEVSYKLLVDTTSVDSACEDHEVIQQIEVESKYSGYIDRQQREIDRQRRHDDLLIPSHINFRNIHGLSTEAIQLLEQHMPETLGQASRISGITPASLSLLLVHIRKRNSVRTAA